MMWVRWCSSSAIKGRAYEATVERVLDKYGCTLAATAVSKDGGIDHFGTWTFPDGLKMQIATQCKHEEKAVGVTYLREFEGVLGKISNTIGVFASASGYSIYAKRFFVQMTQPAIRLTIREGDGIVEFDMNPPARRLLPKLVPGSMFLDDAHILVLLYDGNVLENDE